MPARSDLAARSTRLPGALVLTALLLPGALVFPAPGTADSPPAAACDPLPGVERLPLEAGTVILFGEIHGTAEAPDVVADTACAAVTGGQATTVALEIPPAEDERVRAFLASDGGAEAREALLAGEFWQRDYQDGRSSEAMVILLEDLRRLRAADRPVAVALFDAEPRENRPRDRGLAENLATAVAAEPDHLFLVLTGNIHAAQRIGTRWDAEFVPTAQHLTELLPDHPLISLNVSSTGGSAWVCTGSEAEDCGSRPMGGRGEGDARRVEMDEQLSEGGYHGRFHVGEMTASPPGTVLAPTPR